MPVQLQYQVKPREKREELIAQLELELGECKVSKISYRNKLKNYMIENDIWHISELDYEWRMDYEEFLKREVSAISCSFYIRAFDYVKAHSIKAQANFKVSGKSAKPAYENKVLYLPFHPNPDIAEQFFNAGNKKILVWDFSEKASEIIKRQIYDSMHYIIEADVSRERLFMHMSALQRLYRFCIRERIYDIEQMELQQIKDYKSTLRTKWEIDNYACSVDLCRKALFMQAEEIRWDANVWYLERMNLQPERIDPTSPVKSISFLEVKNKRNRQFLKMYMKYGIGVSSLTIGNLRLEMLRIRGFLEELNQPDTEDVCMLTPKEMDEYLRAVQLREVKAETYNRNIMCILHFFNYLMVKGYIEKIPFDEEYYLKKTFVQHHNRSVAQEVMEEIISRLHNFPEDLRLMFLHLWSTGLRISEVCTLKGNAYSIQGHDAWIQVYQIKMKTYKRIPIPTALYKLMKVYIGKYNRKEDEYLFQNKKGGAYQKGTFRVKMLKACRENNIQNGEYIFRSHDYRHSIATFFYDTGVPLQSIRDYLGHEYEEMTQQYVDFMPKKIEEANEEYFKNNNLAGCLREGGKVK